MTEQSARIVHCAVMRPTLGPLGEALAMAQTLSACIADRASVFGFLRSKEQLFQTEVGGRRAELMGVQRLIRGESTE
ncbi:hypothetical protein L226DRAFT_285280 [Lentinus tigrinus ALCF2SS1-7]|uniref:uncharacterized protein n=1 Tax=Lentinus tigrinus ALCF2SS1-7 TaxID=1328758 RepID=UPI001166175A|nr:hypothetical protein L226DRAFT_285280 [Lentinus tigrinus ALCF2SS1-7]